LADLPPLYPDERRKKGQGKFRDYDLGFVHMDIKQLPKLHVGGREFRKRHLYVAIDRRSRSVHLAVKEDTTEPSATAGLRRPRQCLIGANFRLEVVNRPVVPGEDAARILLARRAMA